MSNKWESNPEIQRFREYLRIATVQPDVDYGNKLRSVFEILYKFRHPNDFKTGFQKVNFVQIFP